jgi:hypothetical protein
MFLSATVLYLIATATWCPGLLYLCVNTTGPTECELLLFVNDLKPDVTRIGNGFDVTTSYNSVDRAAWLRKVTSQRHACRTGNKMAA